MAAPTIWNIKENCAFGEQKFMRSLLINKTRNYRREDLDC